MPTKAKTKTHGTATLACQDHPNYRWTQTKYSLPGTVSPYLGAGVLMFDGEEGGKPGSCFNETEAQVKAKGASYERWYRTNWTPECDCLDAALVFVSWAD